MRRFIERLRLLSTITVTMLSEAEYHRPTDVESACRILADEEEAIVVAGGQSLSLLTKEGVIDPAVLVDINHVDGLRGIEEREDHLRIGATTTHRTVETDDRVAERVPALAEAAGRIADVQIRNAGTVGGVAAYADPTADYPPVFLVQGATIVAETVDGRETYPASEFFVGYYRSALDEQELVTEVRLPLPDETEGTAFEKLAFRENDRAIVNAAARVAVDGGVCTDASVAVGATTTTPVLSPDAAGDLVDADLSEDERDTHVERAAAAAREEVRVAPDPSISEAYRAEMVENLVGNALETAIERAGGGR
jgi:carbon-monoxide dehydrogenase medium subunit